MEVVDKTEICAQKHVSVIIPSYQPDEKLERVITGLEEVGFTDIIVVDDGSDGDKKKYFPDLNKHPSVTLLVHPLNKGKGAALKTAFQYVLDNRPDSMGVVTADGDAQHKPQDILICAQRMLEEKEKLVLGVRDFSLPHVPKRSRRGNRITSFVFLIFCGLKISDTQTGLRAIPTEYLGELLKVGGNRYEYETNMLLAMKSIGMRYCEVNIETVYIDENQTSHFRPFRDAIRIYSLILKYFFSSTAATVIDMVLFYLLVKFLAPHLSFAEDIICTAIARAISSVTNFIINRNAVFKSREPFFKTLLKYYSIAIPVMLLSGGGVTLFSHLLSAEAAVFVTMIKAVVDTILYFVNFRLQREWVFVGKKK